MHIRNQICLSGLVKQKEGKWEIVEFVSSILNQDLKKYSIYQQI